ncbi:MAG TPA: hypothetical protein VFP58_15495 [Candidatus Eisenbacteria bacterium]|nr:hypothetical protein [Candidatus Eisenbacteria bacterium]
MKTPQSVTAPIPQPGDELWWNGFSLPSLDGWVNAIGQFEGKIVVGGRFTQVGGIQAGNIAAWDGYRWTALATGTNDDIMCIAVYRGELIAGGRFQQIDGVEARGVARWNGARWSPLGTGLSTPNWMNPAVNALYVQDDQLLATGEFTMAGDSVVNHVAQWDGTVWRPIGSGVPFPGSAVTRFGDQVFVGGEFSVENPGPGLAKWDGASWQPIAMEPLSSGYVGVRAFTTFQDGLIVGGYFEGVAGVPAHNVARWNGSGWTPHGSAGPDYVYALTAHDDTLRVAGVNEYYEVLAVHNWSGSEWIQLPGLYGQAMSLLSTDQGLVAGGVISARTEDARRFATGVAAWDGSSWSGLQQWTENMNGLQSWYGLLPAVSALAMYKDHVLAGGYFDYCGDPPGYVRANGIASWDGDRWTPFPWYSSIDPPSTFHVEQDTLYAGGYFDNWFGPEAPVPVFRYDGLNWTPLDTLSLLVTGIARYQGDLYIAGRRVSLSHPASQGVYRWSGTQWVSIGPVSGVDYAGVSTMAVFQDKLVVGGEFDRIATVNASGIASWDGTRWVPMGPEVTGGSALPAVADLEVHHGQLIAASDRVFRFDGSQWSDMGSIRGVYNLGSVGGQLFGGGWPHRSGGLATNGPVRWDGLDWQALGSGTNGPVRVFLGNGGHVFMGGTFTRAGGVSSFAIARWDGLSESVTPGTPAALVKAAPNPFRESLSFSLQLRIPGDLRVAVYDLHGRELVVLADGHWSVGSHPIVWDGRDRRGVRVGSGIYFLSLRGPGDRSQTVKVVRMK